MMEVSAAPWLFILTTLVGMLYALKAFPDRWSPLFLMSATWLAASLLLQIRLIDYTEVEAGTWLTFAGAYLCFALGCILARGVDLRRIPKRSRTLDPRRLRIVVMALAVLGLCGGLLAVIKMLATISLDQPQLMSGLRSQFAQTTIGSLHLFNTIAVPFAYVMAVKDEKIGWKAAGVAIILLAMVMQAASLARTGVVRSLFISLLAHHYFIRPLNFKKLAAFGMAMLLLFALILRVRSPQFGFDHRNFVRDGIVRLPDSLSILSTPYIYSTAPLVAFDRLRFQAPALETGRETFSSLRSIASKIANVAPQTTRYEDYWVGPFDVNVATYLRHFQIDFGIIGCLLLPFILGLGASLMYRLAIERRPGLILAYSLIAFCVVITIFSNHFVLFAVQLGLIYLWASLALCLQRLPDQPPPSTRTLVQDD